MKKISAGKAKKFIFLLPIICLVLIFGFSSIPNLANIPLARTFIFKILVHISAYAIFTFSLVLAIENYLPKIKKSNFPESLLLAVVVAVSVFLIALLNEFFQTLIPSRGASLRDVGLDSIGILLALGAWGFLKIRKRRNNP